MFVEVDSDDSLANDSCSESELSSELLRPKTYEAKTAILGSTFEGDAKAGDQILRGQVHDPTAFRMGGVAGHAGLFSTADDLARFCQMLLNGGYRRQRRNPSGSEGVTQVDRKVKLPPATAGGSTPVRILSAETVARMTAPIVVSETGETRGLGLGHQHGVFIESR